MLQLPAIEAAPEEGMAEIDGVADDVWLYLLLSVRDWTPQYFATKLLRPRCAPLFLFFR